MAQFQSDSPFQGENAGGIGGIITLDTTASKWTASAGLDATGKGKLPAEQIYTPEKAK